MTNAVNLPPRAVRRFRRSDLAWYAKARNITEPEFSIGVDAESGGGADFLVRWCALAEDWLLEVFGDAWPTLRYFPDLIEWMGRNAGRNERAGAVTFQTALASFGIQDLTAYTQPPARLTKAQTFGEGVKAARVARGLSQEGLGIMTGVNRRTVQRTEAGGNTALPGVLAIAAELQISLDAYKPERKA